MEKQKLKNKSGLLRRIKAVKLIVFDFDGVFTNNQVIVMDDGSEAVLCNRSDGWGIKQVREIPVDMLVISTEVNPVVTRRCEKLKIPCIQACEDKLSALRTEAARRGLKLADIAFMGNDTNDADCLREVGFPVCVADAHPAVKSMASFITAERGGYGAVREFCDLVVKAYEK